MKKNKNYIHDIRREKNKHRLIVLITFIFYALFVCFVSSCSDKIAREQRIQSRASGKVYKGFQISRIGAVRAVSELMSVDTSSKVKIEIERVVDTFTSIDTFYTPAVGDSCQNLIYNNYHYTKETIKKDSIITIPDKAEANLIRSSKDSLAAEYSKLDKKYTGLQTKYDISVKTVITMGIIIFISIIGLIIYLYLKYKTKALKLL